MNSDVEYWQQKFWETVLWNLERFIAQRSFLRPRWIKTLESNHGTVPPVPSWFPTVRNSGNRIPITSCYPNPHWHFGLWFSVWNTNIIFLITLKSVFILRSGQFLTAQQTSASMYFYFQWWGQFYCHAPFMNSRWLYWAKECTKSLRFMLRFCWMNTKPKETFGSRYFFGSL